MMSEVEKRLSKAGSKAGHLQRHCLKLLAEHQRDGAIPTSGRFLFYELVSRSVVPKDHYVDENGKKKSRTPAQDVADALWHLRRKSRIVPGADAFYRGPIARRIASPAGATAR